MYILTLLNFSTIFTDYTCHCIFFVAFKKIIFKIESMKIINFVRIFLCKLEYFIIANFEEVMCLPNSYVPDSDSSKLKMQTNTTAMSDSI